MAVDEKKVVSLFKEALIQIGSGGSAGNFIFKTTPTKNTWSVFKLIK